MEGGGRGDADGHRLAHRAHRRRRLRRRRRGRLANNAQARHLGPLVRSRRVQTQEPEMKSIVDGQKPENHCWQHMKKLKRALLTTINNDCRQIRSKFLVADN